MEKIFKCTACLWGLSVPSPFYVFLSESKHKCGVFKTNTPSFESQPLSVTSKRRGKDEPIANHFNGQGHKLNNLRGLRS